MDEKMKNELPDEQLESVAGGFYSRFNRQTGKIDIFSDDGSYVCTVSSRQEASKYLKSLTLGQKSN